MKTKFENPAKLNAQHELVLNGQSIGYLKGLSFQITKETRMFEIKNLHQIIHQSIQPELLKRLSQICRTSGEYFTLNHHCQIEWKKTPIAKLLPGDHPLMPKVKLIGHPILHHHNTKKTEEYLKNWIEFKIGSELSPLISLYKAIKEETLTGSARGLGFLIWEQLGRLHRPPHSNLIQSISIEDRRILRSYNIQFGQYYIYMPSMIRPKPSALLSLLYAHQNLLTSFYTAPAGRNSLPKDTHISNIAYLIAGYHSCGSIIIRIDILEKLAEEIQKGIKNGLDQYQHPVFVETDKMRSLIGCSNAQLEKILKQLGYQKTHINFKKQLENNQPAHSKIKNHIKQENTLMPHTINPDSLPKENTLIVSSKRMITQKKHHELPERSTKIKEMEKMLDPFIKQKTNSVEPLKTDKDKKAEHLTKISDYNPSLAKDKNTILSSLNSEQKNPVFWHFSKQNHLEQKKKKQNKPIKIGPLFWAFNDIKEKK